MDYALDEEREAVGDSYVFDARDPKVPVFRPTMGQFKLGLSSYCEKYVETAEVKKAGLVKIIPPKEWVWNQKLSQLDKEYLQNNSFQPVKQHVSGIRGFYRLDMVDDKEAKVQTTRREDEKLVFTREEVSDFERQFWRTLSPNSKPVLYGSDNQGSFFQHYKLNGWNLNNLRSLLSYGFLDGLPNKTPKETPKKKDVLSFLNPEVNRREGKRLLKRNKRYTSDERQDFAQEVQEACNFLITECEKEHTSMNHGETSFGADLEVFKPSELYFEGEGKTSIPGISSAMLYYGTAKTMFAWHCEDMDLFSANYLHYGAPKMWYSVPVCKAQKFEDLIESRPQFQEELHACKQFLRHKTAFVAPQQLKKHDIPVLSCAQTAGQFMLTFPRSYHEGFNLGFNVAEASNFATKYWLPFGRRAKWCTCEDFTVKFSVDKLVQNLRTHKPALAPKEAQVGDLLLVQWAAWSGYHLSRVRSVQSSSLVVNLCSEQGLQTKQKQVGSEWIVDLNKDKYVFPTNKRPGWPTADSRIFAFIGGVELACALLKRKAVESKFTNITLNNVDVLVERMKQGKLLPESPTCEPDAEAIIKEVVTELCISIQREDTDSKPIETSMEIEREEEPILFNSKARITDFEWNRRVEEQDFVLQPVMYSDMYFDFSLVNTSWRWPDSIEMKMVKKLAGGKTLPLRRAPSLKRKAPRQKRPKPAKKPEPAPIKEHSGIQQNYSISMNVNNNFFLDNGQMQVPQQSRQTFMPPPVAQTQPQMTMLGAPHQLQDPQAYEVSLWEVLQRSLKPATQPVLVGDVIIIKWIGWNDEYLVQVTENEKGGLCVISTIGDPNFGTWDFNPAVDDWRRPTRTNLESILKNLVDKYRSSYTMTQTSMQASHFGQLLPAQMLQQHYTGQQQDLTKHIVPNVNHNDNSNLLHYAAFQQAPQAGYNYQGNGNIMGAMPNSQMHNQARLPLENGFNALSAVANQLYGKESTQPQGWNVLNGAWNK